MGQKDSKSQSKFDAQSVEKIKDISNHPEKIKEMQQVFASFDKDSSGTLEFNEFLLFAQAFAKLHPEFNIPADGEADWARKMFDYIDLDKNGHVSIGEFVKFFKSGDHEFLDQLL